MEERIIKELEDSEDQINKLFTPTKTTTFILPLALSEYPDLYSNNTFGHFFVNSFIGDKTSKAFDKSKAHEQVFILLSANFQRIHPFHNKPIKHNYENLLERLNPEVLYDVHRGFYEMSVIPVPKKYQKDVILILKGKYSEISLNAQKVIRISVGSSSLADETIANVFSKHENMKIYWENVADISIPDGQEVWPIPIIEEEVFDKSKYNRAFQAMNFAMEPNTNFDNEQQQTTRPDSSSEPTKSEGPNAASKLFS